MRWLVDGYNVIRRSPELASKERESLQAGRQALCRWLGLAARVSGDRFTVVFDGTGAGSGVASGDIVRVMFSSARETADRLLARLAAGGGAVVSNDREVMRAAERAGAIAVTTDDFLRRLDSLTGRAGMPHPTAPADEPGMDKDDGVDDAAPPRKGNPRRLPKRRRAASRALGRLRPLP